MMMHSSGELSVGRATEMLSLPSAAFNQLLAERDVPTPAKFDESIQRELKSLAGQKIRFTVEEYLIDLFQSIGKMFPGLRIS